MRYPLYNTYVNDSLRRMDGQFMGCVTFSGKIKRFSADHSPEPVMAKLRCSVIGRAVGRPVIGRRDLCYRPCYRPSFL